MFKEFYHFNKYFKALNNLLFILDKSQQIGKRQDFFNLMRVICQKLRKTQLKVIT